MEGWSPQCRFPTIEEDLLLYLAVLEGKKYSAYYGGRMTHSVFHVFSAFLRGPGYSGRENTNAASKDYKEYQEKIERKPMTINGEEKTIKDLLEGYSDLSQLLDKTVPFLSPPNAEWPQCILDTRNNGCNFGHLVRPENATRCDLSVYDTRVRAPLFLCECKYRNTNLHMGVMRTIITGLDSAWKRKWKIVLLFCVKLANFQSWERKDIGCVKIDCRGKESCRVEWVSQPAMRSRKKLIIVLETGNLDAKTQYPTSKRSRYHNTS